MNDNRQNDDAKLDAFLRGQKPDVPAAPVDELNLLLKAITAAGAAPRAAVRRSRFRATPVWASAFALLVLVFTWAIWPEATMQTAQDESIRIENLESATFALAALTYPAVDDPDDFVLRDHPLSGLAEDEGDE